MIASLHYRGNHFDLLKQNDWKMGDVLEDVEANSDGTRDTLKLLRMKSCEGNAPLNSDGTYDVPKDDGRFGRVGTGSGIVTVCEFPAGGRVEAVSLTCRNWRKVK